MKKILAVAMIALMVASAAMASEEIMAYADEDDTYDVDGPAMVEGGWYYLDTTVCGGYARAQVIEIYNECPYVYDQCTGTNHVGATYLPDGEYMVTAYIVDHWLGLEEALALIVW